MLKTKSTKKLFFGEQIPQIAESLCNNGFETSQKEIFQTLRGVNAIVLAAQEDKSGFKPAIKKIEVVDHVEEDGTVCLKQADMFDEMTVVEFSKGMELEENQYIYGADAVRFLLDYYNVENIEPMDEFEIPTDVFHEATLPQWHDISFLFARFEDRISRFTRFKEMNAPAIIIRNEEAQLWMCLEQLERNDGKYVCKFLRQDSTEFRALKDVGFSLLNGWDKEMKEYMDESFERFCSQEDEGDDE